MTPLHSSGQAELRDDKVIAPFGDVALGPDIRPDLLLRLSGHLQTTLELGQLIEIFFKHMQSAVATDGMAYRVPDKAIQVSLGRCCTHSARYELTTHEEDVGELLFYRSTRFREYELANIEGLLSTLLYPLRNALRYRDAVDASFRDPLTGAGNRVALEQTLDREVELAHRHDLELSVLMLDLDHFKAINDDHGHSVGDAVLKATVSAVIDCVRQTDICFRYGGEEFLVLLSNTPHKESLLVAERIRKSIERLYPKTPEGPIAITGSIGCASLAPTDSKSSLIERADSALYVAKHLGRNQVIGEAELNRQSEVSVP